MNGWVYQSNLLGEKNDVKATILENINIEIRKSLTQKNPVSTLILFRYLFY